ncbi:MAG: glycosyltransferase family 2 protein [Candidatus Omnitrophica bacterium]|nr:glycosyltransferase family 2 protein [Candidatus Omnitrophota bacterium]
MREESEKTEGLPGKIKVSVCIPTRNRANFIGEALESIISQSGDNVEIVIVDGASTDNTAGAVQKYQEKFKNLVYYCGKENGGVDRDMAKAIELSRGEYCWLFSDDDVLKPGAMKLILKEIESVYDVYLSNVTVCDFYMRPLRERFWLSRKVNNRVFNLHNKDELIEYFNCANSIGALFSYWSSIVLRREQWKKAGYIYEFEGTAYALASSLFSLFKQKCRLKYIRSSLVFWRNDNVSFQDEGGLVKRFLLDFDGYSKLADKFLLEDFKVRNAFLGVMRREHPWYSVIHATSLINDQQGWLKFKNKLIAYGYSPVMVEFCWILSRNKSLVGIAVKLKRKLIRSGKLRSGLFLNDKTI